MDSSDARTLARACLLVLLSWFLLLPMAYPRYLLGALPFLVWADAPLGAWLFPASVSLGYYGLFYLEYHDFDKYGAALRTIDSGAGGHILSKPEVLRHRLPSASSLRSE